MKTQICSRKAFTLVELLVLIAIIALLAATMLPTLASSKSKSQKINCINNLKQLGVAFRIWEGNHNGQYPMAVSYVYGGANEYLAHSSDNGFSPNSGGYMISGAAYLPQMTFMVMSNELGSPKVVYCPADGLHTAATNFTYLNFVGGFITPPSSGPITMAQTFASRCSYFVGADASEADPQSLVAGDCNIGNQTATANNSPAGWRIGASGTTTYNSASAASFAQAITTTSYSPTAAGEWAWTANDLHQKSGNLLLADGSVQSTSISDLKIYLKNATNTVPGPVVNFVW